MVKNGVGSVMQHRLEDNEYVRLITRRERLAERCYRNVHSVNVTLRQHNDYDAV